MKNILSLIFIVLSISMFGQVSERNISLSVGDQNAFMIDHPDAEQKTVEKIIEQTFKQYGKVKRNRKAKEWACNQCNISMISTKPLNVYYKVEKGRGQVTTYIAVDDGSKFISNENDEAAAEAIEKMNMALFYEVKRSVISSELEDEEDNLKDFSKDLTKLTKKESKLLEDIEKYKEKIRKAEKEIEENLLDQEEKRMQVAKQENTVKAVKEKLNKVGRN